MRTVVNKVDDSSIDMMLEVKFNLTIIGGYGQI